MPEQSEEIRRLATEAIESQLAYYSGEVVIDAETFYVPVLRLVAEVERLRKVENDALWLARLACGSSWPMEMAQRVEDAAARVRAAFSSSSEEDHRG